LKFLAGLEPNRLARRNVHLLPGTRIAADARLARLYIENAKAAQLDAASAAERILHGLKYGFDRLLRLGPRNVGFLYDGIYDVQLDHSALRAAPKSGRKSMLVRGLQVVKLCSRPYSALRPLDLAPPGRSPSEHTLMVRAARPRCSRSGRSGS